MEIKTHKPIDPKALKKRAISSFADEQQSWKKVADAVLKFERKQASECFVCRNSDTSNCVVIVYGIDFIECPECGHLYQKHIISEKDILSFFNDDTFVNLHVDDEQFQYRLEHVNKPKVDEVLKFTSPAGKWLDVACGAGELLYYVKSIGFDAYGFDINNPGCEMAKKYGLNVEQSDLFKYRKKYKEEKFDVASMMGYLDVVTNPVEHLSVVNDMLSYEGLIIIDQPRYDSFTCDLIKDYPDVSLRYINPLQRSVFSQKSLLLMLEKSNFEPLLLWKIGLDFYEFLSMVSLKIPDFNKTSSFEFLIDHFNSFQKIFDEQEICDTLIVIARKKDGDK